MGKTAIDSSLPFGQRARGVIALPGRSRITGWLIGCAVIANLAVAALAVSHLAHTQREADAAAVRTADNLARLLERDLSASLNKTAGSLQSVAKQLERQLAGRGIDRQALWPLVDENLSFLQDVSILGIFDAEGRQVCGLGPQRCRNLRVDDRAYFQRARSSTAAAPFLDGPIRSRVDGSWSLVLVRPLHDGSAAFAGVAMALIPLESFQRLFASLDIGTNAAVSIRDDALHLLVRHPGGAAPEEEEPRTAASDEVRLALQGGTASGSFETRSSVDGVTRTVSYRRSADHPLIVLVGIAQDDILAPWWADAGCTIGLALAFLLVSTAAARAVATTLRRESASRNDLRTILLTLTEGVILHDRQGRVIDANRSAAELLGLAPSELVGLTAMKPEWQAVDASGQPLTDVMHPVAQTLRSGQPQQGVTVGMTSARHGFRWISVNTRVVPNDADGDGIDGVVASLSDMTERIESRRQLEHSERLLRVASNGGQVGVWELDLASGRAWRSEQHARIFGDPTSDTDWSLERLLACVLSDDREQVRRHIEAARETGSVSYECRIVLKDGTPRWIAVKGEAVLDGAGHATHLAGSVQDITERKHTEARLVQANDLLSRLVVRDPLTALYNRRHLDDVGPRLLAEARRAGYEVAVLIVDIDHFKQVNDRQGHLAGDRALVAVCRLVEAACRSSDQVFRYGGEELLLLLPRTGPTDARARAEEIRATVAAHAFELAGQRVHLTVSLGVAVFPGAGTTITELVARADAALYRAKVAGRDRVEVHEI